MQRLLLIVLFFSMVNANAQTAAQIDSVALVNINNAASLHANNLKQVYTDYKKQGWLQRLDSLPYSSVFMEAIGDSTYFISIEWYFKAGEENPFAIYSCGKFIPKTSDDYKVTFTQLKKEYDQLKPNQTLDYERVQVSYYGCIRQPRKVHKAQRKKQLQKRYQLQSYIDRNKQKIIVSAQTPPKNPKFRLRLIGGGF